MNKKGFTLIELLGVITILSVLALITIPIIDRSVNQGKDNLYDVQNGQLVKALKDYYAENLSEFNRVAGEGCKSVGDLKSTGYLPTDLKDPRTNKDISEDTQVCAQKNGAKVTYSIKESS